MYCCFVEKIRVKTHGARVHDCDPKEINFARNYVTSLIVWHLNRLLRMCNNFGAAYSSYCCLCTSTLWHLWSSSWRYKRPSNTITQSIVLSHCWLYELYRVPISNYIHRGAHQTHDFDLEPLSRAYKDKISCCRAPSPVLATLPLHGTLTARKRLVEVLYAISGHQSFINTICHRTLRDRDVCRRGICGELRCMLE